MDKKDVLQGYVNNFRREFTPYLKAGVGMTCSIYPAAESGAIFEFTLGQEKENTDIFNTAVESVGIGLNQIEQHSFAGDLSNVTFAGTNSVLEPDRIIIIKGEDDYKDWDERAANADVSKLIQSLRSSKK